MFGKSQSDLELIALDIHFGKMQMDQVFEYIAKYHCAKCRVQWFLKNRIRNRPSLCKLCGMPTYPNNETICSFFHVPRYRSISRLLTKWRPPQPKHDQTKPFQNIGLRGTKRVFMAMFDRSKWWIFNEVFFRLSFRLQFECIFWLMMSHRRWIAVRIPYF